MNQNYIEFLQTTFQNQIEESIRLFNQESTEEQPYLHKYAGRKILDELLKNDNLKDVAVMELNIAQALINFYLGVNHMETEENQQAQEFFLKSLKIFEQFPDQQNKFSNILLESYNSLGYLNALYEKDQEARKYLKLSKKLYKQAMVQKNLDLKIQQVKNPQQTKEEEADEKFIKQLEQQIKENKEIGVEPKSYIYQGIIDYSKLDSLFTLTLFFMAQTYTKEGDKKKASKYCGKTLQRQMDLQMYELKDWCVNCISLSEYYVAEENYQQAYYLLLCGLKVIPEGKKKQLRATLHMSLGRFFSEFMVFASTTLYQTENINQLKSNLSKEFLKFDTLQVPFPKLQMSDNIEHIKQNFKIANTQFKKALEYFVLDGYVTEHVQILVLQNKMYKHLARVETDLNKIHAMHERRRDLLEPILKELNKKVYAEIWEKILVECAEIYNSMFENRYEEIIVKGINKDKPMKVQQMNAYGIVSQQLYQQIIDILQKEDLTKVPDQSEVHQSIINAKFNIAKISSKVYYTDKQSILETCKKALDGYQGIVTFAEDLKDKNQTNEAIESQKKICIDMTKLLVNKLQKLNSM